MKWMIDKFGECSWFDGNGVFENFRNNNLRSISAVCTGGWD